MLFFNLFSSALHLIYIAVYRNVSILVLFVVLKNGCLVVVLHLNGYVAVAFVGYVHIGTCRVSPDNNFLAYTLDIIGHEQFFLQIKDLSRNSIISNHRVEGVVSLAWAQDGSLLYTLCDQNQRPYRQTLPASFS